jgi:hypothetical protein
LPASKSAIILSFIPKVETILGLLGFSFDFAAMDTEFIAVIRERKHKLGKELV